MDSTGSTGRRQSAADRRLPSFVESVRAAARRGIGRLLPPVWDDYDRYEIHRWASRFDAVTFLIGVRAKIRVSFLLPSVPGVAIEIDTGRGEGCWACGPGDDPEDPVDVMAAAFDGDSDPSVLSDLILPELFDKHTFRTQRGWQELRRGYEAHTFRYFPGREGLRVTFIAELEAHL